jgi:serine/threonine protein kinase
VHSPIYTQGNRSDKELSTLHREMDIMRTLDHPNIIKMIDAFDTKDDVSAE